MSDRDETRKIVVTTKSLPRALPHLVVLVGPEAGRAHRITEAETVIGRSDNAAMMLLSTSVSRRHALVRLEGGKLTIEDLGSKNGTFVGLEKIKRSVELSDGDKITIGDTVLLQLRYSVAFEEMLHETGYATGSQDPLTGLSSLPRFLDRLRAEYASARRHRTPLAIVYLRASESAPVAAGGADDLFQVYAQVLRHEARAEDLAARTGSDELMVLLRSSGPEGETMITRIRDQVVRRRGEPPANPPVNMVVIPLAARVPATPEAVLAAVREEARRASGGQRSCMLVVPAIEVPVSKESG